MTVQSRYVVDVSVAVIQVDQSCLAAGCAEGGAASTFLRTAAPWLRLPAGFVGRRPRLVDEEEDRAVMGADSDTASRDELVRSAVRWCALSVIWALVVGAASLAAGVVAGSVALIGFGGDSLVDGMASAVLVWRFRQEGSMPSRAADVERLASRAVGATLLLVAAYLVAAAAVSLAAGTGPSKTVLGTALAGASLVVLPILAYRKLGLARALRSRALHSDGILSAAGALLAATTLLGLLLSAALQWWWSDSVAALVIAAVLIREGWTSVTVARRGEQTDPKR